MNMTFELESSKTTWKAKECLSGELYVRSQKIENIKSLSLSLYCLRKEKDSWRKKRSAQPPSFQEKSVLMKIIDFPLAFHYRMDLFLTMAHCFRFPGNSEQKQKPVQSVKQSKKFRLRSYLTKHSLQSLKRTEETPRSLRQTLEIHQNSWSSSYSFAKSTLLLSHYSF